MEEAIAEIIATQAWKPLLGYKTLAEAWDANHLSETEFGAAAMARIVYRMLEEDTTPDEIADKVKGVGPERVKTVARQRKAGVPADKVTMVRRHPRRKPCEPSTIRIRVGAAKMREYHKIADDYGMTVEDIAREAISERFDMLLAVESKRKDA